MVNQDKASRQIALLRQEIQALSMELMEYKQGKRTVDAEGEHVTDVYNELNMLKTDNENLRMRIKALQKNIDSQTIELTELKVANAMAFVSGKAIQNSSCAFIKIYSIHVASNCLD